MLVVVTVAARVAVPVLCLRGVPAARPEGLGATVAGSVPPVLLVAGTGVTAAVCALLTLASLVVWLWPEPELGQIAVAAND